VEALSIEARVAYQQAIERIYWQHRLWPKENPKPKPALEAVIPSRVIQARVEDSLRLSNALDQFWGQPITGAQLQAEMERQARDSKQPEVLRELWAALSNDPHVIAEMLARPALAERLARSWYEETPQAHALGGGRRSAAKSSRGFRPVKGLSFEGWWQSIAAKLPVVSNEPVFAYRLPEIADESPAQNAWSPTHALPEDTPDTAVWTGAEMIVWGGMDESGRINSGSRYNPATDTWRSLSGVRAPDVRNRHSLVWTGLEMIVWGGCGPLDEHNCEISTGGRYNPTTDTWRPTSLANVPLQRMDHTAVWTGSEMIVWGGCAFTNNICSPDNVDSTGARYDPVTNTWQDTSTVNAPPPRHWHTAVWTGTEMIVWGGASEAFGTPVNTGGRYNPATNSWVPTTTARAPVPRFDHSAAWTGGQMIVWGGTDGDPSETNYFDTGGSYNPATDRWRPTSRANAPSPRAKQTAVWTGSEMIVWGGCATDLFCFTQFNTGGRYNPSTNTWTATSLVNAPEPRSEHVGVWTGSLMIVWGGFGPTNRFTGGRYDPASDTWTPTNANQPASGREFFTAIWTGTEMIVWGGDDAGSFTVDTGARYFPATDSWLPTAQAGAPFARYHHTALWTGTEMIIWGGGSGSDIFDTGGRYNPATNTWTPTTRGGAPDARASHSAVWTGAEMIVWGGSGNPLWMKTGGRYNLASNSWTPVNTTGAPSGRDSHSGVWTGSEMIVWGGTGALGPVSSGGRYNPATNSWSLTNLVGAPSQRHTHAALWTGSGMLIWGGWNYQSGQYFQTGGLYDAAMDTWIPTSTVNAPTPRAFFAYVWTGTEMIVWGGCPADPFGGEDCFGGEGVYTGGQYNPSTDSWRPTPVRGAPGPRYHVKGVWTGSEMIVWSGWDTDKESYTWMGGRYRPPQQ
jgi:N-acetylneuraminic acid mutarotase